MKNLKHLLCAGIVACSLYFNAFSASSSSEEHASLADTGENAESMEDIQRRYQTAQYMLELSGSGASSDEQPVPSDDARKRRQRPETEIIGEKAPKYQHTGNGKKALEPVPETRRIPEVPNEIKEALAKANDFRFEKNLPQSVIDETLNTIFTVGPRTYRNISEAQAALDTLPEFETFINIGLQNADFKTIEKLWDLLSERLKLVASIKITGKDAQGQIVAIPPYIAVAFSETLKNEFSHEADIEQEPLIFENLSYNALKKIVDIATQMYEAKRKNNSNKATIAKMIRSVINETPNAFKDLFEAAESLKVVPAVTYVLRNAALYAARKNRNFGALEIMPDSAKYEIAKRSHNTINHHKGLPEDINIEKSWSRKYYKPSIEELIHENRIPAMTGPQNDRSLNLSGLGITDLTGLADIPGIEAVRHLWLAGNQIKTIPARIFAELPNLRTLKLNNNPIEIIPADAFFGLTNLMRLELRGNLIRTIDPYAFRGLGNLKLLDLSHNAQLNTLNLNALNFLTGLFRIVLESTPLIENKQALRRINERMRQVRYKAVGIQ